MSTRPRTAIGVLAGWQVYERTTPNWFLQEVLRGIAEAGRALDCDVLLSCGIDSRIDDPRLVRPAWPAGGECEDFVPVGSWNTDGIVFVSPLRTATRRAYARALQEEGFPVVFVGGGDGRPAVVADSAFGLRLALEHLRAHGHRRVAFVSGDPLDTGDSRTRLADFIRLRRELGLDESGDFIAPGLHSEEGGYEAMQSILAQGGAFTAVLASNDTSAIGAIRALAEARRRVPQDVAVIGFDDQPAASAHVPPLATVHYPLADAGRRAMELLVDLIRRGRRPPDTTAIPTTLLARRSCGCIRRLAEPEESGAPALADVARRMAAAVEDAGSTLDPRTALIFCERLADAFEASRREASPTGFEAALAELLQQVEADGDRAHCWHPALSRLRRDLPAELPSTARIAAEDLLELGRLALSESADRQERRRSLQDSVQADRVSALTVPLQSVQDETGILRLLAEHGPALGVRPVCLACYEGGDDEDPFAWSRVQFLGAGPGSEPAPPDRLETRRILREHLPAGPMARCLAVLPLVRQGRPLGFLAVETATLAGGAAIARQLAVALESVRLQAAVRALTVIDDLTGLRNRRFFEGELRREVERARRFDRDLALVLVDVDHFKAYNDTFGHRAGDDALRRLAACLSTAASRRLDAVTRYGGEEFAILLAETDADGARLVAERAREAVLAGTGFRRPLTVSAGVAATRGEASESETLVLRADAALYRAKHDGRNRVHVAP